MSKRGRYGRRQRPSVTVLDAGCGVVDMDDALLVLGDASAVTTLRIWAPLCPVVRAKTTAPDPSRPPFKAPRGPGAEKETLQPT